LAGLITFRAIFKQNLNLTVLTALTAIKAQGRQKQDDDIKNAGNHSNNGQKLSDMTKNHADNIALIDIREPIASQEPSEPSADEAVEQQIPNSIYRIGRSDLFACKNCKVKGDKPFMMKHPQHCKGSQEGQSKQIWR
jgi:hypothetical protein